MKVLPVKALPSMEESLVNREAHLYRSAGCEKEFIIKKKQEVSQMQLVEQHIIDKNDPRYTVIDAAAFASKNLYNAALYEVRQAFIHEGRFISYNRLDKLMQSYEAYKALPAKVAQWVLKGLVDNWKSFKEARESYRCDPSKFTGRPQLPKYKHKTDGRNLLVYTIQALSKPALKRGLICPSMLPISIKTRQQNVNQVRIVPRKGFYVIEVVYEQAIKQAPVNPAYYAGIDIGLNNLAALASNKPGFQPVVVNGRPVKSTNQFYNKRRAELQKKLGHTGTTARMERMTNRRNRRVNHYLHTASKRIIDLLVQEGIGTLAIGKNDGWKQECEMGKRNNQNFVQIPHARFIQMLTYKAELVGITVLITEESYTSKASFLDRDPLPVRQPNDGARHTFSGKRVKRGLYQASNGRYINADINGAGNIIRKVAPDAFQRAEGVEDFVVHPVRMALTK
jgi:putative transposase